MKPILKWSGGKSEELEKIKKYIPDNIDTYIEPFIGGGALYFYLNHSKNVINDIHKELIAFYNSIKKGYSNEIYLSIGYVPIDEMKFMFNVSNFENTSLSLTNNINGFDLKMSSNYNFLSDIPDYGAKIEISNKF